MKREAALIGIGILLGSAIGLSLGLRPAPAATATQPEISPSPAASTESAMPLPAAATQPPPTTEPQAEIAALLAASNPINNWCALVEQLTRWSEHDPRAALAYVAEAPRFPMRNSALAVPLSAIARKDPAAAAEWLRRHATEADRRRIADEIVSTISDSSPREALALASGQDLDPNSYVCAYALGRLAESAPAESLAIYATLGGGARIQAAQAIAGAWSESDPEAALRWCESLRGQPAESAAASGILERLAQSSPRQAAEALVRLHPPGETTCSILRSIAFSDTSLALSCLSRLPAELAPEAVKTIASTAFGADPERIAEALRSYLPEPELAVALRRGWDDWRESDRKAAEEWADNLADPALRAGLLDLRLTALAQAEPAAFLASIDSVPDAHLERDSIRAALASLPPADAARWIATHPSLVSPATVGQAVENYFARDNSAADAWSRSLPAGELRDRALAGIADHWSQNDGYAEAAAAIDAIGDPKAGTRARFKVYLSLRSHDRTAAAAWLASQPLATEIRANWELLAAEDAAEDNAGIGLSHSD